MFTQKHKDVQKTVSSTSLCNRALGEREAAGSKIIGGKKKKEAK